MFRADLGFIGLAVMGQNLVLNMERNGYTVAVYNRTTARTDEFLERNPGLRLIRTETLAELVSRLDRPRIVMIMVQAGPSVDAVIGDLLPLLDRGDLIVDGGNSHFKDSDRRTTHIQEHGLDFLGIGISGGEEGALWGPAIMPGGAWDAYAKVEGILTAISAKAPSDQAPCLAYMGPRGAGHYVKMVHNAIEYGDMQLIAEAYDLLHRRLGLTNIELADTFTEWNEGELDSFLVEITAQIFRAMDPLTDKALIDVILDKAAQKGTGKWASQDALDLGSPVPTINAAVVGRILSSLKNERVYAAERLPGPAVSPWQGDREKGKAAIRDALYASKISTYAQGMALLGTASAEYGYQLQLGKIAAIWRGGCIIRARFLEDVMRAYQSDNSLPNLLLDPAISAAVGERLPSWRMVVSNAVLAGIPVPGLSASLAYYDSYRTVRLPANLIQGQRDLFGAHTYERIDQPGDFHSNWG